MNYIAGIDIGSVSTKCVIINNNNIISNTLVQTGVNPENSAETCLNLSIETGKLSKENIKQIVSTGYGRYIFKQANSRITEITAAGKGGFYYNGMKGCIIIDLGGQDTKIIDVNNKGEVVDFLMNDKCAAGTGRFIEMMSRVLETDLNGLSELALKSEKPVLINSTCSVFAESEVVSLIANANNKEDIALGVLDSIALRILRMFKQLDSSKDIIFCGGGAKSGALQKLLQEKITNKITVPDIPQFIVAYGAALSNQN